MTTKNIYEGGKVAVSSQDKVRYYKLSEEFQGISMDQEETFPKGLGAKHPFEFSDLEKLYIKYGIVSGIINKETDSTITDFEIKLKNPNAQAIIDDFVHKTNFHTVIRAWLKEGLLKGNGFIELDLDNSRIRILNANNMYVKRNNKGKVLSYNQWTKPFKNFNRDSPDLITFTPEQIAHLVINKIPNDPYGIGIIYPNERIIENLVKNEQDLQLITTRKAGSPYHVKVGQPGVNVPQAVVDGVRDKLTFLKNTHEWVTDGDVTISAIQFAGLGQNLTESNMYFYRMLLAGVEMPEVLMGSGQLNEGIATTQLQGYKRKISSRQIYIASIIEEKIIRPLLRANNLDEQPNFIWELPTEEDIDKRLVIIGEDLKNPLLSTMMRAALEIEKAKLMGFEDLADKLPSPEEALEIADRKAMEDKERQKEETEIPQPEVPGAKPRANQSTEVEILEVEIEPKEGWVTGDDGRHYYIDDEGNSYSGQNAMVASAADKMDVSGDIKTFQKNKMVEAKKLKVDKEIKKNNDILSDYTVGEPGDEDESLNEFYNSDSPATIFDKKTTQKRLKEELGGDSITLYRGINQEEINEDRIGRVVSWSSDKKVAQSFADDRNTEVISEKISIKNIVASSKTNQELISFEWEDESEFLVLQK